MSYQEVDELLNYISMSYKTEIPSAMIYSWVDILQAYDYQEVKQALDEAMSEEKFQNRFPQAQYLVRNLVKKYDKVDYSKQVIYCNICRKPLNQSDYEKHFSRCSSVEYILSQYKRFGSNKISKKELYEMPNEEFEEKYNQLLRLVQERTQDTEEKKRIEFIFNPPCEDIARKFIEGKRK